MGVRHESGTRPLSQGGRRHVRRRPPGLRELLPFERLVVAYLAFFALAAVFARVDRARRIRVAIVALACAAAVFAIARTFPLPPRLWLPFFYIPLGYWIPVPLVPPHRGGAFEAWLRRCDESLRHLTGTVPRWLVHAVEIGYLTCFPLIPAAFAVVWIAGAPADATRFWTAVLIAGYSCYITLPWLVSRPPRLIDAIAVSTAPTSVSRANVFVLGRVSHHLNTFPSGHVAVSIAAALSAGTVSSPAGIVLGVFAGAVALGAVAGRYHYVVDVLLGAGVGIIAAAVGFAFC